MSDPEPITIGLLVTYNSQLGRLEETLRRLGPQLGCTLVLDNSDHSSSLLIEACLGQLSNLSVEYHSSEGNVGIAEAQNYGIKRARELGADYVLFLDDDSQFPDGGVKTLVEVLEREKLSRPSTVGIGPLVVDSRSQETIANAWQNGRMRTPTVTSATEVSFLVSSGSLIDMRAFSQFGLLRSEYFIDQVDKEWGLRVSSQGARLIATSTVSLPHMLGDTPTSTHRGRTRYTHESYVRDYYLTRNAILLMRDVNLEIGNYLDLTRLLVVSSVRKALAPGRSRSQRLAILHGWKDGVLNRRGPRDNTVHRRKWTPKYLP